jgi:tetratricopeptide (TPR) repeat protein
MKAALDAARATGKEDVHLEQTLNGLGAIYKEEGKYAESEKMFREAIAICEKGDKETQGNLYLALNNLAGLYVVEGKVGEAIAFYRQSLQLAEKAYGKGDIRTSLQINNLASVLIQNGYYNEAAALIDRIWPVYKNKRFQNSGDFAYLLLNAGLMARERGQFKSAEILYKRAVQIGETALGANHRYIALGLQPWGEMYEREERFAEAEKLLERAEKITEAATSADSPDTAHSLVALARCYVAEGKYSAAEPLCKRASQLLEQACGPNHVSSAEVLCVMAQIREQTGEYAEAEKLLQTALRLRRDASGPQAPAVRAVLRQIGDCYMDQGKLAEAEDYYKRALSIQDQVKAGGIHPEIAEINKALAQCYMRQSKFADAKNVLETAKQNFATMYGAEASPQANDVEREIAEVLLAQKSFSDAQSELTKVIAFDESHKDLPRSSARLAADYESMSKAYEGLNDRANAQSMSEKATALKRTLPGAQSIATAGLSQSSASASSSSSSNASANPAAASNTSAPNTASPMGEQKPVADKWALIVGVSNFADSSINLKYATKDAIDFRNFLIEKEHFKPDHVRLLTDGKATRENIIGQLGDKWLGRAANRDDLVVIYMSSHGSTAQQSAGGVNFLVAHDTRKDSLLATGIPMQWLTNIIKDQVHSERVVMILDVCHGGAAAPDSSKGINRKNGVDVTELSLGTGQAVLCSSLADQVSWESSKYQNSVFTRRLIEALSVNGDKTTLKSAYDYLRDAVESEVLRDRGEVQTPVLNEKQWTGADAVLSVIPAKPRPGF